MEQDNASMQYFLKTLNAYSRQKYKLSPNISESQELTAGDTLIVALPENSIVDLSTFAWFFEGKTGGNGVSFPKHVESLVDRISVEINGQMIESSFRNYNLLFRRLAGLSLGDKDYIRGVLQNSIPSIGSNVATYATYKQFCIKQWLGFIGSAQPQCLDTSILGTVRLHISLAPNSVLIKDTYGAGTATYSLRKNYFTVDTISLNDGVYYSVVNARLSDPENPIEIPFQTWTHFSKGQGQLDGQTQATLSTESLDILVGTYQQSNLADNVNVANLNASSFFSTGASNITGSRFTINNVPYPSFEQKPHDAFESTLQAFNLSQDVLGGTDSNLNSLDNFKKNYFLHAIRLSHPTTSDERVKSGMSLRGTNASITFETDGTEDNVVQHVWAGHTCVLKVKPYKQLEVVL
jgi:hypothetical protein